MITFTKEQLIASAHARIEFAEMMLAGELEPLKERTWSIELELARIALASLEAEAVAYIRDGFRTDGVHFCGGIITAEEHERTKPALSDRYNWKHQPLYTAPPAPVSVPDALADDIHSDDYPLLWSYNNVWNACRSAMLQGADRNSPVIPDGWALVPIEPTEDMIVNGFESEPDESFSDEKEWEAYDAMSGCQQAAHRAKLCWAAMIAAAPKI